MDMSKLRKGKGSMNATSRDHNNSTQFQTTKHTSAGFFPMVSAHRTNSIDQSHSRTSGFVNPNERTGKFGATSNVFGQTAGSMFSDIKKKVTTWDKDAHLDPSLT